jgi:hypothetical protein
MTRNNADFQGGAGNPIHHFEADRSPYSVHLRAIGHNGKSIGKLEWDKKSGEITGVHVAPEHVGKGIENILFWAAHKHVDDVYGEGGGVAYPQGESRPYYDKNATNEAVKKITEKDK